MAAELSPTLVEYFAATNAHDVARMVAAFAEDSVVMDEGRQHRGSVAIREWMAETIAKYDFKVDALEWTQQGRSTLVLVAVTGRFPGSPLKLRYEIMLDGPRITRLEIG